MAMLSYAVPEDCVFLPPKKESSNETTIYDIVMNYSNHEKLINYLLSSANIPKEHYDDARQEIIMSWITRKSDPNLSHGETASYAKKCGYHAVLKYRREQIPIAKIPSNAVKNFIDATKDGGQAGGKDLSGMFKPSSWEDIDKFVTTENKDPYNENEEYDIAQEKSGWDRKTREIDIFLFSASDRDKKIMYLLLDGCSIDEAAENLKIKRQTLLSVLRSINQSIDDIRKNL